MHKATKKLDKFLDESYDVSEEDEENQTSKAPANKKSTVKTPVDVKTANFETAEEELKKATQIDMKEYNDLPINASQKTDQLERPKSGTSLKSMSQHYAKGLKTPKNSEIEQTKDEATQEVKSKKALGMVNELKEKLDEINALHDGLDLGGSVSTKVKIAESLTKTKKCSCAIKQLRARKAGKLLAYNPIKMQKEEKIQFQNRRRDPVTFAILPEEIKKFEDPELKLFFGHDESLTLKPDVLTLPHDDDILMLHQLIDESQSVIEIVENVHDTAEKLLIDTEKALEKLELNKNVSKANRHTVQLPLTTKMKEAAFGFAPEIEIRELREKANLAAEEKPQPMIEVLNDSMEEINKVLFDASLQPELFFTSPTLPKINDNIAFDFSPETGALRFEKRSSSLTEEENDKIESSKPIHEENTEDFIKSQPQNSKLRRAEAAEDLSLLGITTEKTCGCGMLRSKVQSPFACESVDVSTAKFIDEKLKEADEKKNKRAFENLKEDLDQNIKDDNDQNKNVAENHQTSEEIQKKDPIEKQKKPDKGGSNDNEKGGSKNSKTKKSKLSGIYKEQKEDDDDGYLNLPNVPSTSIGVVESSVWIDENQQFFVSETESDYRKAPLGQASSSISNKTNSKNSAPKKKESKMFKVKSFVKRLPNIFRSSKD